MNTPARHVVTRTIRLSLHVSVAVISPMDAINAQCDAERTAGVVTSEQVRAFIHPPTFYRSPDELAEYAAVRAEAHEQLPN